MKRFFALIVTGSLAFGLVGQATAGKAGKPVKVFEDATGDAGIDQGGPVPGFDQAGFDLVSGEITKVKKNLEFKVTMAAMPDTGSLPEGARFIWHFNVDGEEYRFTIKSQDIGKPDLVAQTGTERIGRVDLEGHFRLEQCATDTTLPVTLSNCTAVAYEDGTFDPASKSFTAIVPLKDIKAKTGSLITAGTGAASNTCPICWVAHYAERSLTPTTIFDATNQAVDYKVPKK